MPGMFSSPSNRYDCVCGFSTGQYHVMTQHRRQCDSWKEHNAKLKPDDQVDSSGGEMIDWACPHPDCGVSGSSPDPRSARWHIDKCPHMLRARQAADSATTGDLLRDLDLMERFEGWLRDNGRA